MGHAQYYKSHQKINLEGKNPAIKKTYLKSKQGLKDACLEQLELAQRSDPSLFENAVLGPLITFTGLL